jgi:hypothetical protein
VKRLKRALRQQKSPAATMTATGSGISCTSAELGPTPVRASGSWQSCPACDGKTPGSCLTCEGAGVVFAARPALAVPAATTSVAGATATPAGAPTMVCAHPDTPPLTPAMRFQVWRQPYGQVDHVSESPDELFVVQTATLAEAVQLERLLEAYDEWQDRDGSHDIGSWDGSTWRPLDSGDADTAREFLQSVYDLDDVAAASDPSSTGRRAGG